VVVVVVAAAGKQLHTGVSDEGHFVLKKQVQISEVEPL